MLSICSFFSAIAFILNLLTILFGIYLSPHNILSIFSFALILFSYALLIFVIEINLSNNMSKTHLKISQKKKDINDYNFSNKIYLSFFI